MSDLAKIELTGLEAVLANGDIGKLSQSQRVEYYHALCNATGLNPVAQPFEYLQLQGKTVLYAKRQATEQLRKLHGVSVTIKSRETVDGVHSVVAHAATPDGRTDEAVGAVYVGGLKGDALANALMKAETKAKRRVTLSMCGLGMLDESEIDSIPRAEKIEFDAQPVTSASPALASADEQIALAEIQACNTVDDLRALSPRLKILAPSASPHRARVLDAYRARQAVVSQPADPEQDGR